MLSWIFVQKEYGRLGNRIHTHANLLAFCINNKINLHNFSFSQYAKFFEGNKKHRGDCFVTKRDFVSFAIKFRWIEHFLRKVSRSDKWLRKFFPWIMVQSFNDDHTITSDSLMKVVNESPSCRFLVLRGWNICCPNEIRNHEVKIKSILTPAASFRNKAESSVNKLRLEFDTLVGVHIRRGDYKNYMQGTFFYTWQQYASWIRQALEVLQSERSFRVGFLICSDEQSPRDSMKGLPVHQFMAENPIEDLHSLSLCDYLMGPPSSFGTWASWHGDAPRLVLEQGVCITERKQFEPTLYC